VWVPIGAYWSWNGDVAWGVFVLVWGFLVVSFASDYVIRPRLVGKKGHGHPLLMLVSLVGGIEVMGLAGLIVAPILMSLFVAVLRIYERELATGGGSHRRGDVPH
jgi:predicted PurR-regulated permease PerM